MKKIFIISMILSAFCIQTMGQFSITGEFRPRGEYRRGYKQLADDSLRKDAAILISQRSRINLNYKAPLYKIGFSIQDVRFWGDQIPKEDVSSLAVYQAWISYKLHDSLWVKLGRQELVFDNERLFSNNNWNQNSQAHDALRLNYQNNNTKIDIVSAYNSSSDQLVGNDYSLYDKNYKLLNIILLSQQIGSIKAQLIIANDGYQKAGTKATIYMRYTNGAGIDIPISKTLIQGRGYYQSGKTNTGQKISAYYFSANLTDTLCKNFIPTLGMEWLSGNDAKDTANTKQNAFDPLYGSNHAYQGSLDYFTSPTKLKGGTDGAGLIDIYLKTQTKLGKITTMLLDYHVFLLQNNYVNNNKTIGKFLASEVDLSVRFKLSKEATLETGYSFASPSSSMELFSGGNKNSLSHWAYIMFTLKPNFL